MPKKGPQKPKQDLVVLAGDDGNVYQVTLDQLQDFKVDRCDLHYEKAQKLVDGGVFHMLVDEERLAASNVKSLGSFNIVDSINRVHFMNLAVSHNQGPRDGGGRGKGEGKKKGKRKRKD